MAKITKLKAPAHVQMVNDNGSATRVYTQIISGHTCLRRELKISPKAMCTVNESGFKMEVFVPSVTLLIGIGKDHTAELIMTRDAYDALVAGDEINITTKKDFIKFL